MTKTFLLFSAALLFVYNSYSQHYYMKEYNYFYTVDLFDNLGYNPSQESRNLVYKKRIDNKVKTRHQTHLNHKGDTSSRLTINYNPKGRISKVEKTNKKGNKYLLEANYSNDTILINYTTLNHKKKEEVTFDYNENGELVHLLHLKKGEKQFEIQKIYDGKQLIASTSIDFSKRKPRTYKTANTLDEEGNVTKTAYYKNDKLLRIWEYDCSEKGVEVKPKKNEDGVPSSSSCSWRGESNDGSYIVYYRTLNGKRIYLFESHYSKDSILKKTKTFDEKDRLKFESTYYKNQRVSLNYKNNGKLRSYFSESTDPSLGIISSTKVFYGVGKSHISTENEYNENALLSEQIRFYRGKKTRTLMDYSYYVTKK